jgi:hypothetical protein
MEPKVLVAFSQKLATALYPTVFTSHSVFNINISSTRRLLRCPLPPGLPTVILSAFLTSYMHLILLCEIVTIISVAQLKDTPLHYFTENQQLSNEGKY